MTARTLSTYETGFKLSNISVDEQFGTEYGSTTRMSADVGVCKHLHLQYYQVVFMWNTLCILTNRCTVPLNWSWQIPVYGLLCWMCQMYTGSSRRPKSPIDSKILKFCRLVYRRSGVKYVLKRVSFWSEGCTKELTQECAYFLGQTS